MDYTDYYKTLGLDRKASSKQIKAAFRKLAREYHPDVNPGNESAEKRFKEINEAHEVLSDPEKRERYDRLGADWNRWQRAGQPGDFDWAQWMGGAAGHGRPRHSTAGNFRDAFGGSSPFSDFFTSIFGDLGGGGSRSGFGGFPGGPARHPPAEHDTELQISLAEAHDGATRVLSLDGHRLTVRIPRGATTGTRVRVPQTGQGRVSGGGDLYLRVKVAKDARFEPRGSDLYTTVSIDLWTAVLGGEVVVPTLTDPVTLKIRPGSQNGQTLRVRGRGMPKLAKPGERGHLYARIEVRIPEDLTAEQRELFERLRELGKQRAHSPQMTDDR